MVDFEQLELTEEVNLATAAKIGGCDKKTIKILIDKGVFRVRFVGNPDSAKPNYRIPLEDVLLWRNTYHHLVRPEKPKRFKRAKTQELKHLSLDE